MKKLWKFGKFLDFQFFEYLVCFCKKLNQKRNKVLQKGNCVAEICCCSPQCTNIYEICSTMFKSSRMKSNHMHRSFNKSKGIDTGSNEECLLMLNCALLRFGRLVQQGHRNVAMMCRIKKRIFWFHDLCSHTSEEWFSKAKEKALKSFTWCLGMYFSVLCPFNLCQVYLK